MFGRDYDGVNWGFRQPPFDNYDEQTENIDEELEPQPTYFGWPGFARRGFGPGFQGRRGPGFGPGFQGGPNFWGPAFRYGPRMGRWAFRQGWRAFGPQSRRGWGGPGWGGQGWGNPEQGPQHPHQHGEGHGHGPHGEGRGHGHYGRGYGRRGNLDMAINYLEQVQGRLENRLSRVKQRLDELKAERARRQESQGSQSQAGTQADFTPTSSNDTDVTML